MPTPIDNTEEIIDRIETLEENQKIVFGKFSEYIEPKLKSLENSVKTLGDDVLELKTKFPFLATKVDISELAEKLSGKIDTSVTGLLRETLAAQPAWKAALWTAVAGISATISIILGTIMFIKGIL